MMIGLTSAVGAISLNKEYTDNRQRSIIISGQKTNLINKTTNVSKGTKLTLRYQIAFKNTAAQYYSSNTNIATIGLDNGVVTFKKVGSVTITVKGSDNRTYRTKFNVTDTYVTVSIKEQRARLYVNGKLARTAPVVTGKPGVTPTPKGTFTVAYKQRNTFLDGSTVGYDYFLPVKYWIPLANTGGVGLHDASWRANNKFGGNFYIWDGSHGCINMREADVAFFYKHIKAGTVVKIT